MGWRISWGRESIKDDLYEGGHSMVVSQLRINLVGKIVLSDRRLKLQQIAEQIL